MKNRRRKARQAERRESRASQHTKLADQARGTCNENGLFLLVERQTAPRPGERWSLLCKETGVQTAVYFPESRSLLLRSEEGSRLCRHWREAVAIAADHRAGFAARQQAWAARA